jgi:hypothetical protein
MSELLSILQHSLGVDQYGRGEQYRSHFVAGPGHSDYETCLAAERQGLMLHYHNANVVGGHIFCVTDAGRAYVEEHSPPPPKLSQSQRRYREYLSADCGLSFGEWLKRKTA